MQIRIFCTKIQFFDEGLTQNVPLKMCQKISQKCLTQNVSKMSQKCLTQNVSKNVSIKTSQKMSHSIYRKKRLIQNVSLKMSSYQEVKFCQN